MPRVLFLKQLHDYDKDTIHCGPYIVIAPASFFSVFVKVIPTWSLITGRPDKNNKADSEDDSGAETGGA